MSYAEGTKVSVEASRTEIERTVTRYGASKFGSFFEVGRACIVFEAHGRRVLFDLPLPKREDFKYVSRRGYEYERSAGDIERAWEQSCRQRWRALGLVIKAKLEAVDSGITTFEDEFLAHIVLPDGKTVGRWMKPQIEAAYTNGKMPPLLPAGDG